MISSSKLCALVADDQRTCRKLVRTVLNSIGILNVIEAADGADALEAFHLSKVDVVFTDVRMPTLDGIELIRMLRTEGQSDNPYLPIIVVTAYTDTQTIKACRDAGATELIGKPFTAQAILSRLQVVTERPRPFIRSKQYFGPDRRRRNAPIVGEDRRN